MAPARKARLKPCGEALGGGLRGPDIGANRDVHADITGGAGKESAEGEADRLRDAEQISKDDKDDHADDADRRVLAGEIGLGAFLDGGSDLLHARRPGVRGENSLGRHDAVGDRERAASNDENKEPRSYQSASMRSLGM